MTSPDPQWLALGIPMSRQGETPSVTSGCAAIAGGLALLLFIAAVLLIGWLA